ncbi:MAG: hypothetical protein JNM25_06870 [Planctomycetes bacterium]|nr:hypothetical protein [Planctomycetota bacterium]
MQRRATTGWFLAAAFVVLCLSAAGAPRRADDGAADVVAARQPSQGPGSGAFRHGSHLAPTWHTTERGQQFEQHCRICHDYDAAAPLGLGAPTTKCAACHFSDASLPQGDAARLVVRGGEPTGAARTFAYDHARKGHRERACADCHAWTPGARGDFLHADVVFAMPASLSVCADCHHHGADDPGTKSQRDLHRDGGGAAWRATWDRANGCESCHKAGGPRLLDGHRRTQARTFEHASHVPADDLGPDSKGRSCRGCHAIDGAAAAASGMGVEQKSCGECHYGDRGTMTTRWVDDAKVERMPTQFSHVTEGHRKECSQCHPMAAGARDPDVGRMYADCTKTCHSERRVERHGAWSCNDCHRSADPRSERDPAAVQAIARVAVRRPVDGSRFAFAAMRHPGITAAGAAVHAAAGDRACADCHRREVAGLANAAVARPFVHDGHLASLAQDMADAACTSCHVDVRATTSSARVQPFHAESVRESGTCTAKCHQSPKLTVTAAEAMVEVPVFSHAQHGAHACTECHVGDGGITGLRDAALGGKTGFSCARCHGHKEPEKIKVTGGYDTTKENDTCRECHAPKAKPSYVKEQRSQRRFQLAGDVHQFHDKGGACASCHGLEQGRVAPSRSPVQVLSRYDLHASHSNVRRADGSVGDIAAVRGTDSCLSCHAWDPRRR